MEINIPTIEQKYITLFETQQGYDDAQPDFIEVNWSAVKDTEHPEEVETEYYPSTRQTHGYEPVDGDKVKPDAAHKSLYYTYDHILKTFFLEIIWGYYGWEWVDYEYTDPDTQETATLKGGNLYKVKEITEVPSIPDGYRLEHINNFLNSQDKITKINSFDTSNLVSIRHAFSNNSRSIEININNFPKVKNAFAAFSSRNTLKIKDNRLSFPILKVLDSTFSYCVYNGGFDSLIIDAPNIEDTTSMLEGTSIPLDSFSVNSLFNNHIEKIKNLTKMFFYTSTKQEGTRIIIDLTNSTLQATEEINMTDIVYGKTSTSAQNKVVLDIRTNHKIILDGAFTLRNNPELVLNGNESYVKSIENGFRGCTFNIAVPTSEPINDSINDSYIYSDARFHVPVVYDFSPNNLFIETFGHFSGATFYDTAPVFRNVDRLLKVDFSGVTGQNVDLAIDFLIYNPNYTYPQGNKAGNVNYINGNADYKYRSVSFGSGFKTIIDQEFYVNNNDSPFSSSIIIAENSNVKVHFWNRVVFSSTQSIVTPYLYIDSQSHTISRINIMGDNIRDIYIITNTTSETDGGGYYYDSNVTVNFSHDKLPGLVNLYITGKINPRTLDFTGQYNISLTTFENFVNQQDIIWTLILQQDYYNTLSSAIKDRLLSICDTINLIQESNE